MTNPFSFQDVSYLLHSVYVTLFHFSHDRPNRSPSLSSTTFQNFPVISDLLSEASKFQHHIRLCSKCSILLVSSLNLSQILFYWSFCRGIPTFNFTYSSCITCYKVKVKCTLVQALRLCTGRTAHRRSRRIDLPFHDHGTRRGWGVSVTPRPLFTPGKVPVFIVQESEWAPGLVWTGVENLAPTGIWSPDRPARNQSLCRLNYPGPHHLL